MVVVATGPVLSTDNLQRTMDGVAFVDGACAAVSSDGYLEGAAVTSTLIAIAWH